jgi:SAM-dependent methyltransferase
VTESLTSSSATPALLNLGCGFDTHSAFVNLDLIEAPGVIAHDLRRGIPFRDASFDLVYHSLMLSHLFPDEATVLTRECYRVLKPGGILRVVTEDLEQMCLLYLQKLEAAAAGDAKSGHDYDWMLLELYDQATREYSGGGILEFLRQEPVPNETFICSRMGAQGRRLLALARRRPLAKATTQTRTPLRSRLHTWALTRLLGTSGVRALEIGRFRMSSGQVSRRMYDRYSVARLLLGSGFSRVERRTAADSGYLHWSAVNLDLSPDGAPAKPHALIMEGVR